MSGARGTLFNVGEHNDSEQGDGRQQRCLRPHPVKESTYREKYAMNDARLRMERVEILMDRGLSS